MYKLNLNYLDEELSNLNICLNDNQKNQFNLYFEHMIKENGRKNLTRILEPNEVVLKHYIDSIYLYKYLNIINNHDLRIADIGAGAGFPSIPLKICFPNINFTMIDSINKKVVFLEEVISILGLENAEAICGRAEDILREDGFRENYDFCISRAVANLSTLAEYCIPFVKLGGQFIAYKSDPDSDEIKEAKNAITILGGEISRVEKFDLPGTDEKRCFVFVDKISDTDLKYPRRAGIPLKRPLK